MPRNTKNKKIFKVEITADWISIHALKPKRWSAFLILITVLLIAVILVAIFFKDFRNQALEIALTLLQILLNYAGLASKKGA